MDRSAIFSVPYRASHFGINQLHVNFEFFIFVFLACLLLCRNGFQKLDKIKDANRQSRQLEELTDKMRDCKRYSFRMD